MKKTDKERDTRGRTLALFTIFYISILIIDIQSPKTRRFAKKIEKRLPTFYMLVFMVFLSK